MVFFLFIFSVHFQEITFHISFSKSDKMCYNHDENNWNNPEFVFRQLKKFSFF